MVFSPLSAGADGAFCVVVQREGTNGDLHLWHHLQPGGAAGDGDV